MTVWVSIKTWSVDDVISSRPFSLHFNLCFCYLKPSRTQTIHRRRKVRFDELNSILQSNLNWNYDYTIFKIILNSSFDIFIGKGNYKYEVTVDNENICQLR